MQQSNKVCIGNLIAFVRAEEDERLTVGVRRWWRHNPLGALAGGEVRRATRRLGPNCNTMGRATVKMLQSVLFELARVTPQLVAQAKQKGQGFQGRC